MSFKDAIRVAAAERDQQENNKNVNTASNKAIKQSDEAATEFAGLTIKVPKRHRVHWLISAKKQNTSLTAAITEALNARFGEPDTEN